MNAVCSYGDHAHKDSFMSDDPFAAGGSTEVDNFLGGGGGAPAAKFPKIGHKLRGLVIDKDMSHERDYDEPDKKMYWRDGKRVALKDDEVKSSDNPSKQAVITVLTLDEGTWDRAGNPVQIENDNGERRLFIKGHLLKAVREAIKLSGAPTLEVGGIIEITHSGLGKANNPKYNAPKLYVADYTPVSKVKKDDPLVVKYNEAQESEDVEDGDPFA